MTEHWIPESNVEKLKAAIARLNKKADKIGCKPVTIQVTSETKYVDVALPEEDADDFGPRPAVRLGASEKIKHVKVLVDGEAPKFNGWKFVARLEHLPEGSLAYCAPNEECPEEFRHGGPVCQHCNLARKRKDTYVLKHDSGDFKQVGSDCIADFLGHKDPAALAAAAEALTSGLENLMEHYGTGGIAGHVALLPLLTMTSAVIKKHGWTSATAAKEDFRKVATRDLVMEQLWDRVEEADAIYPDEQDTKAASGAIEWAKAQRPENDYLSNIRVIGAAGVTTRKGLGLAVSILPSHQRALGREAERAARAKAEADSKFVGEVGARQVFDVEVVLVMPRDGDWGVKYFTKMVDKDGNVLVWYAQTNLEKGKYRIKATVKKHDTYQGTKQTTLTRGVVL